MFLHTDKPNSSHTQGSIARTQNLKKVKNVIHLKRSKSQMKQGAGVFV